MQLATGSSNHCQLQDIYIYTCLPYACVQLLPDRSGAAADLAVLELVLSLKIIDIEKKHCCATQ